MSMCADCVELGQQCYNCWAVTPSTLTDIWVRTKRAECDGLRADKEVLMAEKAEMLSWWAKEKEGFQARIVELEEMVADRQYADTDGMAHPEYEVVITPEVFKALTGVGLYEIEMGEVLRLREENAGLIAQMQKLLNKMSDTQAPPEAPAPSPTQSVLDAADHLLHGRVTPKDHPKEFKRIEQAVDQAKRGAVGTIPGARG